MLSTASAHPQLGGAEERAGRDGGCSPILAALAPPACRRMTLMARTIGGGRTVDQPSPQERRTCHIGRGPHPGPTRSVRMHRRPHPQASPRAATQRRSVLPALHRGACRCIRARGHSDRHVAPAPRRTTRSESCRANDPVRPSRVHHSALPRARSLLPGQTPPRYGAARGRTAACSSPAVGPLLAASGPRIRQDAAPCRALHLLQAAAPRTSSRQDRAHAECARSRSTTDPTVPDSPCTRLSLIPRTVCLNGSIQAHVAARYCAAGQGVPQPCPSDPRSHGAFQTHGARP
ncbi:hypothetical protein HNP11_004169 [Tsukamurella ocularis]|nr:hypothetical protein [Tsukamurella ocularis]